MRAHKIDGRYHHLLEDRAWDRSRYLSIAVMACFLYLVVDTSDTGGTQTHTRERRKYLPNPDLITALGIYGTGRQLAMLATQGVFTLGTAPNCNLQADEKYLSARHGRLERLDGASVGLRVTNISSGKNDIVHRGIVAKSQFILDAGDYFTIGDTRYFALSDEMRISYPVIAEILGSQAYSQIDDALMTAVHDHDRHIVITGERGCDQGRLARALHHVSPRRQNFLGILPLEPKNNPSNRQLIRDALGGSLLVDIYKRGRLDKSIVEKIPDRNLRLMIVAPSLKKIESSFPSSVRNHAAEIRIPSLLERNADIPDLMNQWFVNRESTLRFVQFPDAAQVKLKAYRWPGNLEELRGAVDDLCELHIHKSARAAERETTFNRTAFRHWLDKVGLSLKMLSFTD